MTNLQVRLYPVRQRACIHSAGLPCCFSPVSENRHRRNTADIVLCRGALRVLGIELGKADTRFQLRSDRFEVGRHHFARPTPGGPEIHHHRQIATAYMFGEILIGQLDRLAGKQRITALSAAWMPVQAVGRDTVYRVAVRTYQVD